MGLGILRLLALYNLTMNNTTMLDVVVTESSHVSDGRSVFIDWLSWHQLCTSPGTILWSTSGCNRYCTVAYCLLVVHTCTCGCSQVNAVCSDYIQEGGNHGALIFTLHQAFHISVSTFFINFVNAV